MPTFFRRRYMREELKSAREVFVGIFILVLAAGICAALVIHATSPGDPLFEISAEYLERTQAGQLAAAALPDLGRSDWSEARGIKTFSPDTLYEKINGRADLYLQYNFKQLTFAKYIKDNDPDKDIQVWLYDMSGPENAQGIYLAERSEHYDPVDIGRAGYRSGASIFFWKGSLYVSVMTIDESLAEGCRVVARMLADGIEDSAETSWAEIVLPKEDRVSDSFAYLANDVFGLDFLKEVYVAEYANKHRAKLFAHQAANESSAQQLLERYAAFFAEYGELLSEKDGVIVGNSGGVVDAVFRHGRYLVGVSDASDADVASEAARSFRKYLVTLGEKLP